jgi:hypothetical protein
MRRFEINSYAGMSSRRAISATGTNGPSSLATSRASRASAGAKEGEHEPRGHHDAVPDDVCRHGGRARPCPQVERRAEPDENDRQQKARHGQEEPVGTMGNCEGSGAQRQRRGRVCNPWGRVAHVEHTSLKPLSGNRGKPGRSGSGVVPIRMGV